jgi:hypothetical protein
MKKWLIGGIILLIVVIGAFVFLFILPRNTTLGTNTSSFPLSAEQKVTQPDAFVTNFYTWYLTEFSSDIQFDSNPKFIGAITNWLTPSFAANLKAISDSTEQDPILLAQDYQNSWLQNITTTILSSTPTTSNVLLSLGTPAEFHQLVVHLVLIGGVWHIDSVSSPTAS